MSDNALTTFGTGALPAHLSSAFAGVGSNIPDKQTVPSLSYEGKVWTIAKDGSKTKLMSRNADGDEMPLSIMKVVVLDSAARRGRQYYEGTYDPNKVSAPVCWSVDGIHADKNAKPPAGISACDKCPMSVKGSKVLDNGNATTACSQHRMLAVVPAGKPEFTALRLKIAITSDWDSQSPDMEAQGWYSYSKYLDFLKSRGVPHTAALVTKIRFDANAAYPKLFFAADRWLTNEEAATIAPRVKTPEVQQLIDGTYTPAGVDGVRNDEQVPGGKAEPEPQPEPEIAPATAASDEEIIIDFEGTTPAAETIVEAEATVVEQKAAPKKATKKADPVPEVSNDVPDEVAALLSEWG